jgi:hypothetical protein
VVILEPPDAGTARLAGIEVAPVDRALTPAAGCAPAEPHRSSESRAVIRYADHPLGRMSPLSTRRLCRFDFNDE